MNANRFIYFLGIIIFFASCSATKGLKDNENLYSGDKIKIEATTQKIPSNKKKDFQDDLEALLRPKPNSKILGMPIKLWIYNSFNPKHRSKGLGHWVQTKFGEPPVIASASVLEKNRAVFQNRLENIGFFRDTVTLDTTVKNKKLTATYTATVGYRYTIRNVTYPADSSAISKHLQRVAKGSLLKPKLPYSLDKIKPETPPQARKVYRIKDVVVYADYDIKSDTSVAQAKVTRFGGYKIVDPNNRFQPKI